MTSKKTAADNPDTGAGARDWMGSMQQLRQSSLDPLRWFGTAWLESVTEMNRELADFLARRIQQDVRTQHEILNCGDPSKLQDIQLRFVQQAIEDYSAETGTLTELGKALMDRVAQRKEG